MMMFPRVFLILLVPIFVHGAPYPPRGPGDFANLLNPTDDNESSNSGLTYTPEAQKPRAGPTVDVKPPPPYQPLPPNPGRTIHSTDANQSLRRPSAALQDELSHLKRLEILPPTTCRLQKGTMYFAIGPHSPIRKVQRSFRTSASGIFITLQGETIFAPGGITIVISDHTALPGSSDTEIKIIDKNDQRFGVFSIFPGGSVFCLESSPHESKEVHSVVSTGAPMIVTTPAREIVYVSELTSVIILPNILRLPDEKSKVRIVTEDDQTRVKNWCKKCYDEDIPPDGMKKEPQEEYEQPCFKLNLWRVWSPQFKRVQVGYRKDDKL